MVRRLDDAVAVELGPLFRRQRESFQKRFGAYLADGLRQVEKLVTQRKVDGYVLVPRGDAKGFALLAHTAAADILASLWVVAGHEDGAKTLLERVRQDSRRSGRRLEIQDLAFGENELGGLVSSMAPTSFRRLYVSAPVKARAVPEGNYDVRAWRDGDLAAAADLSAKAFADVVDSDFDASYRSVSGCLDRIYRITRDLSWGRFDRQGSPVAMDDWGRVLGYALVTRLGPAVGHLVETAVAPDAVGHGIGRSLLARVLGAGHDGGLSEITLCVSEANHRARSLYEREGFRRVCGFQAHVWEPAEAGKS